MSDLDYRSWGETRNCHGCRFWSEMLAHSDGGSLKAYCLAPSGPKRGQWTPKQASCSAWQEGSMGAIDQPGGDPYA